MISALEYFLIWAVCAYVVWAVINWAVSKFPSVAPEAKNIVLFIVGAIFLIALIQHLAPLLHATVGGV